MIVYLPPAEARYIDRTSWDNRRDKLYPILTFWVLPLSTYEIFHQFSSTFSRLYKLKMNETMLDEKTYQTTVSGFVEWL
jgi:hypothetical protein